jgi:hypothetical protein
VALYIASIISSQVVSKDLTSNDHTRLKGEDFRRSKSFSTPLAEIDPHYVQIYNRNTAYLVLKFGFEISSNYHRRVKKRGDPPGLKMVSVQTENDPFHKELHLSILQHFLTCNSKWAKKITKKRIKKSQTVKEVRVKVKWKEKLLTKCHENSVLKEVFITFQDTGSSHILFYPCKTAIFNNETSQIKIRQIRTNNKMKDHEVTYTLLEIIQLDHMIYSQIVPRVQKGKGRHMKQPPVRVVRKAKRATT